MPELHSCSVGIYLIVVVRALGLASAGDHSSVLLAWLRLTVIVCFAGPEECNYYSLPVDRCAFLYLPVQD